MAQYKLYYFNLRGRAELSRLIFAYAGIDYEDVRIERSDWLQHKSDMPFGKVPALEADGQKLGQSHSIARYLARQFGLTGQNDWEAALADSYVDYILDISSQVSTFIWEQDPEKQRQLAEKFRVEILNPDLETIEGYLNKNPSGYIVGNQVTWADLAVFNFYDFISQRFGKDWLAHSTKLTELYQKIGAVERIKKWIESRPQTPL